MVNVPLRRRGSLASFSSAGSHHSVSVPLDYNQQTSDDSIREAGTWTEDKEHEPQGRQVYVPMLEAPGF